MGVSVVGGRVERPQRYLVIEFAASIMILTVEEFMNLPLTMYRSWLSMSILTGEREVHDRILSESERMAA